MTKGQFFGQVTIITNSSDEGTSLTRKHKTSIEIRSHNSNSRSLKGQHRNSIVILQTAMFPMNTSFHINDQLNLALLKDASDNL